MATIKRHEYIFISTGQSTIVPQARFEYEMVSRQGEAHNAETNSKSL